MEIIANLLNNIESFMGTALIFLLFGTGLFFSLKLGFIQFRKFIPSFKQVFGGMFSKKNQEHGSLSSFQALATAIAAQIGTGNVAGVASAILAGGPGAVFWMWVSALLGMSTIFAEAVLAQHYRDKKDGEFVGGPAYYISKGVGGNLGKFLAGFFAVMITLALGIIGNMVQSNSIAGAVNEAFGLPTWIMGVFIAIAAALIFIGGVSRIGKFAETVVPVMAVIYLLASLFVIIKFSGQLIPTLELIIKSAFSGTAVMGGIVGASVKEAMKLGAKRGLFSNEAGMGSTPHAHAVAKVRHPAEQGLAAMCGVFIDTVLVCTSTAMVILVTQSYLVENPASSTGYFEAAMLTQQAFHIALGGVGKPFLAICLTFFAFTTVVGWYYFGESNIKYLFGTKALPIYRIIVVAAIIFGSIQKVAVVWLLSDVANEFMVVPNLIALILLSGQVKSIMNDYQRQLDEGGEIKYNYLIK
ncbi:MAG: sodium:alanine symporter family protein [Tissierellia bacterium]|nr:sodium:alanine symporter family protein [Tissierellia bacterium]